MNKKDPSPCKAIGTLIGTLTGFNMYNTIGKIGFILGYNSIYNFYFAKRILNQMGKEYILLYNSPEILRDGLNALVDSMPFYLPTCALLVPFIAAHISANMAEGLGDLVKKAYNEVKNEFTNSSS